MPKGSMQDLDIFVVEWDFPAPEPCKECPFDHDCDKCNEEEAEAYYELIDKELTV